jgi:hypothetical protein
VCGGGRRGLFENIEQWIRIVKTVKTVNTEKTDKTKKTAKTRKTHNTAKPVGIVVASLLDLGFKALSVG